MDLSATRGCPCSAWHALVRFPRSCNHTAPCGQPRNHAGAWCRTLRKGTKTLIWDNAETLLFKAVMDDDLAYFLERQMAPVSEPLDEKVGITSIRIAKQTGGRGMSSFGGAPTRTMLHRYKFAKRVPLFPKVSRQLLSHRGVCALCSWPLQHASVVHSAQSR